MAYNSAFPATYTPMYYQPPVQPVQPQNSMIWVQGEAAARAYLMAPNTTLPLWDSEGNTIFLKTTDPSGMPSMKILDYTIREQKPANAPVAASSPSAMNYTEFATHAEIEAITAQIEAIKAEISKMPKKGAPLNE